ncbi:MAG TPA: hypothetical protein VMY42_23060 [Thermoguttaceae bacterium]|nr:hypothetical protein [Thermoguttaceae bacterium]
MLKVLGNKVACRALPAEHVYQKLAACEVPLECPESQFATVAQLLFMCQEMVRKIGHRQTTAFDPGRSPGVQVVFLVEIPLERALGGIPRPEVPTARSTHGPK